VRGLPAAILLLCAGVSLHAGADEQRARVNYMLNCQGCYLPDGDGTADRIPRLKNFVGYFLHSEDGRAFLINVSGVASSPLSDSELAELVTRTLDAHPHQVGQYRSGKTKLLGFFVGQIMQATHGQANPKKLNTLLRKMLDKA